MIKKSEIPRHLIDTTLRLTAARGWHSVTLTDIAAEAGLSLAEIYRHFPDKAAILAGLMRQVDAEVLAGSEPPTGEETARDRLFDLLMQRFDALRPYREGLARILREAPADLATVLAVGPQLVRSMLWMLEAAGIPAGGLRGWLRAQALAALYLAVMREWFEDDSPDLARTMAALDRRLRQAERLSPALRRRPGAAEPGAETAGDGSLA